MSLRSTTHIFSGQAQLKKGLAIYEQFKQISAILEIDIQKNELVGAWFTVINPRTNEYLSDLLRGVSLAEGIDPAANLISEYVHLATTNAMIKAVESAYQNYCAFLSDKH